MSDELGNRNFYTLPKNTSKSATRVDIFSLVFTFYCFQSNTIPYFITLYLIKYDRRTNKDFHPSYKKENSLFGV